MIEFRAIADVQIDWIIQIQISELGKIASRLWWRIQIIKIEANNLSMSLKITMSRPEDVQFRILPKIYDSKLPPKRNIQKQSQNYFEEYVVYQYTRKIVLGLFLDVWPFVLV